MVEQVSSSPPPVSGPEGGEKPHQETGAQATAPLESVSAATPAAGEAASGTGSSPAAEPPAAPAAVEPKAPAEPELKNPLAEFDAKKADEAKAAAEAAKAKESKVEPKAPEAPKGEAEAVQKPSGASAEPFTFTDYVPPEDFKADFDKGKDRIAALQDTLTKADLNPQQRRDALLNMHVEAIREVYAQTQRDQQDAWNNVRREWKLRVMSDPEFGGSGFNTAMGAVARMRDLTVPEKDRKEFDQFLEITGAGYHPAWIRMMHNFAKILDEAPAPSGEIRPTRDNGGRAGGRKSQVLYDNTRSRA